MAIDSFTGEYKFLSNFSRHPVTYGMERWPTAEHAYQAAKTLVPAERRRIWAADGPGMAKRLGRKVTLQEGWDERRDDVMRRIVWSKFYQSTELAVALLATGDEELIEGNDWGDDYWGMVDGQGENMLGKILMEVRAELREKVAVHEL